ncbi:myb-like protein X [Acanthaster planci]|uniref:Myb-like protein X n=1 Tax=Acanthaster planci TaxID=133434 RepID=A0A8B7ZPE4_ACAPL|nr:myb-like protein X [Acanthaster planci]
MASLPKICAMALVLAAGVGSEGRIPPHQSCCNQHASNQPIYGTHTPSSRLLMNSFFRDPWFDHDDLWHDPFSWSHHFPWGFSHRPWGMGLSVLHPPRSAERTSKIGCQWCQDDSTQMKSLGIQEAHRQRNDLGCQSQEEGDDNNGRSQTTGDKYKMEREEQQQLMEEQRLQQEMRKQRLEEDAELQRHQDERRWQEERMRQRQQRRQEEEAERRRQQWEEEQRVKKWRAAEKRRIQQEQEMRRKRMQEQEAIQETKQQMEWNHQKQGMNDNMRHHQGSSRQALHSQFRKTQVATLYIPGYTPEDVSVTTSGNRLVVQGKHVCDCQEECTAKEFKRGFEIPKNVDPASLDARLVQGGQLTISGNQYNARIQPTGDWVVSVEGDGSFSPRPRNVDPTCGGRRTGFKLKKLNKRTGQIVEDEELVEEVAQRTFEGEVDEDGVTMEVEY